MGLSLPSPVVGRLGSTPSVSNRMMILEVLKQLPFRPAGSNHLNTPHTATLSSSLCSVKTPRPGLAILVNDMWVVQPPPIVQRRSAPCIGSDFAQKINLAACTAPTNNYNLHSSQANSSPRGSPRRRSRRVELSLRFCP